MPKPDAIPAGAAPTPADALRDSRPGTAQLSRRVDPLARGGVRGPDRGGAALDAVRIHGGYGYSTEYDVERYFRDAPLMFSARAPTRSSATSSPPSSSSAAAWTGHRQGAI